MDGEALGACLCVYVYPLLDPATLVVRRDMTRRWVSACVVDSR